MQRQLQVDLPGLLSIRGDITFGKYDDTTGRPTFTKTSARLQRSIRFPNLRRPSRFVRNSWMRSLCKIQPGAERICDRRIAFACTANVKFNDTSFLENLDDALQRSPSFPGVCLPSFRRRAFARLVLCDSAERRISHVVCQDPDQAANAK